ncbi:unnamed protein product [Orchesella dallaii]|uniref:Uncharacterized protein n=1 Tax=Orchesella dallaii TaxID=48710 RepID=A0ABP1PXA4_9HEXA
MPISYQLKASPTPDGTQCIFPAYFLREGWVLGGKAKTLQYLYKLREGNKSYSHLSHMWGKTKLREALFTAQYPHKKTRFSDRPHRQNRVGCMHHNAFGCAERDEGLNSVGLRDVLDLVERGDISKVQHPSQIQAGIDLSLSIDSP